MRPIPPFRDLQVFFNDPQAAIDFLKSKNVFYIIESCVACGGNVSLYGKNFKCTSRACRKTYSLFSHSFFSGNKITPNSILELGYLWLIGSSFTSVMHFTQHGAATVTAYYGYFRQLVASSLDEDDSVIGGENIEVEIDESKFGKRRYNRGHHVEGSWVFGGIERTAEKKFFIQVVPNRTSETLLKVIEDHVKPGSIVLSDCWKAYANLSTLLELEHRTVNHSVSFVDKETQTHTNTIEAKWGSLKRKISIRGRIDTSLDSFLFEQIWRHKCKGRLWDAFLDAFKDVYYD